MSHELIYTSAPRGLDAGACGFCTVQRTFGLDRVVQRQLEALSSLGSTASAAGFSNAALVMHTSLVGPTGLCRVLTKISVGGEDYSGRGNLVAHHVVLSQAECPSCGPAVLAATAGVLKSKWDGQVAQTNARSLPQAMSGIAAGAENWRHSFGDAGTAGVVLFELARQSAQPVWVIVPDGTDTLRLIADLTMCMESDERWSLTFASEYQPLPAGTQCRLRFVSKSSPLIGGIAQRGVAGIVDLTRRGSIPAEAVPFATDVRAGRLIRLNPRTETVAATASRASSDNNGDTLFQMAMQESRSRRRPMAAKSNLLPTLGLISNASSNPPMAESIGLPTIATDATTRRNLFQITGLLALSLATLAICGTGTATIMYLKRERVRQEEQRLADIAQREAEAVQAQEKLRLVTLLQDSQNELNVRLQTITSFSVAPLRQNPVGIGDLHQGDAIDSMGLETLKARIETAIETATTIEQALLNANAAYLAARVALHHFAAEDDSATETDPLEASVATGVVLAKETAQRLNALASAIPVVANTIGANSRDALADEYAAVQATDPRPTIEWLKPGLVGDSSEPTLRWISQRLDDLDAFLQHTSDYVELPFETAPTGITLKVERPATSTGEVQVKLYIASRITHLLNPDTVAATFQAVAVDDNSRSEYVMIRMPENLSSEFISAFVAVQLRGDLLDHIVVPKCDMAGWSPKTLTAEMLLCFHRIDCEILLNKNSNTMLAVEYSATELSSVSGVLKPSQVQRVAGKGISARPIQDDRHDERSQDDSTEVFDDDAFRFWSQINLTSDGFVPESADMTPRRQFQRRLEEALNSRLRNAADELVEALSESHWASVRREILTKQKKQDSESKKLLLRLEDVLHSDEPAAQRRLEMQMQTVAELVEETQNRLDTFQQALTENLREGNISDGAIPADQQESAWVEFIQKSDSSSLSEISSATNLWIDDLKLSRKLLSQWSTNDFESMEFETTRSLWLKEVAIEFQSPMKPRIITPARAVELQLPLRLNFSEENESNSTETSTKSQDAS